MHINYWSNIYIVIAVIGHVLEIVKCDRQAFIDFLIESTFYIFFIFIFISHSSSFASGFFECHVFDAVWLQLITENSCSIRCAVAVKFINHSDNVTTEQEIP